MMAISQGFAAAVSRDERAFWERTNKLLASYLCLWQLSRLLTISHWFSQARISCRAKIATALLLYMNKVIFVWFSSLRSFSFICAKTLVMSHLIDSIIPRTFFNCEGKERKQNNWLLWIGQASSFTRLILFLFNPISFFFFFRFCLLQRKLTDWLFFIHYSPPWQFC